MAESFKSCWYSHQFSLWYSLGRKTKINLTLHMVTTMQKLRCGSNSAGYEESDSCLSSTIGNSSSSALHYYSLFFRKIALSFWKQYFRTCKPNLSKVPQGVQNSVSILQSLISPLQSSFHSSKRDLFIWLVLATVWNVQMQARNSISLTVCNKMLTMF